MWLDTRSTRPALATVRRAVLIATVLVATLFGAAAAQELCPEPTPPEVPRPDTPLAIPEDVRIGLFNTVTEAVQEFYLFDDYNGADWGAVTSDFAPLVLETANAWEYYDLLNRMVGALNDPFTTFVNPLVLEAVAAQEATYGGIGALLDRSGVERPGEALRVVAVFPDSPAEAAGLRPRDRILAVDDDDCPRVEIIRGPAESTVRLLVASPNGDPREVAIERGDVAALILPEARRIGSEGSYAYLRLVNLAGTETLRGIEQAMESFTTPPPEGIVLDVRGTRTGAPGVMLALLSYFLEGEIGSFYTRSGDSLIELPPAPLKQGFDQVPLVVLVDGATVGEAEQLAALLQAHGRAQVVGQSTAGVTHGVRNLDFVGGSLLQMTVIGLRLPDGSVLERTGVTPDAPIEDDWAQFGEEDDPYLLAAFELLADPAPSDSSLTPASPVGARLLPRTIASAAVLLRAAIGQSQEGDDEGEPDAEELAAEIVDLELQIIRLLGERQELRRERDRLQQLTESLTLQADEMEASRLLLIELRKDLPESRFEAELYLERLGDLGRAADPVRLAQLARRLDEASGIFLDWRHAEFSSNEERNRAFSESGAHGFSTAFFNYQDAVLLSVSNRLESLLVLMD